MRLGAVVVGYSWSWHLPSGEQWLGIGWALCRGGGGGGHCNLPIEAPPSPPLC